MGLSLELDGFVPERGAAGESVRIDGSGFTAVQEVRFNGTPASFSITADTQIIATTPANATSGPVTVHGPNGIAISESDFQIFNPGPRPFAISPGSAVVGTIVEIEGELFGANTRVFFGPDNIPAQSFAPSNILVRAIVPDGAETGRITLCDHLGCNTSEFVFQVVEPVDLKVSASESSLNTSVGEPAPLAIEISNQLPTSTTNLQLLISLPESTRLIDATGFENMEFEQNGRVALVQFPALPSAGGTANLRLVPTKANANGEIHVEIVSDGVEQGPQDNQLMVQYKAILEPRELVITQRPDGKIEVEWPRYPEAAYLELGTPNNGAWVWSRVQGAPDRDELTARIALTPSDIPRVARLRLD